MTEKEYQIGALDFLKENSDYSLQFPINLESDIYDYLKKTRPFIYNDHVDAGILADCLVELGYFKFLKRENNSRYHSLTENGFQNIQKWK